MELIVEESDWAPRSLAPVPGDPPSASKGDNEFVASRILWDETNLRQAVKSAGSRWLPKTRVWVLTYDRVADLDLEDRIAEDASIQM